MRSGPSNGNSVIDGRDIIQTVYRTLEESRRGSKSGDRQRGGSGGGSGGEKHKDNTEVVFRLEGEGRRDISRDERTGVPWPGYRATIQNTIDICDVSGNICGGDGIGAGGQVEKVVAPIGGCLGLV